MNGKKILIVEDDPIISYDISIILKKNGYDVSSTCHNATKAIDFLSKTKYDAAILDIHLGGGQSGIDVAKIIHEKYNFPYIFLTSFSDPKTLEAAQEQGPYGYLVKPFQEATLLTTLSLAINNHKILKGSIGEPSYPDSLTSKEKELCKALLEGLSYQSIAEQMHLSINTIRYHVKNIYSKCGINSRAELVACLMA